VLAVGVPFAAAVLWATLAVPGDRSRSGTAPVPVPGWVRLLLELALFGAAAWALFDAGQPVLGWALTVAVGVHYLASYDRIAWLLRRGGG
jgi:hypothetical protein